MQGEHDGMETARRRIAEEAQARTGTLDLGFLGLPEIPEELFALSHLRRLYLGENEDGSNWSFEASVARVAGKLDKLVTAVPGLEVLSISHTDRKSVV